MRIGIDAKWYFTGNISGRVVLQKLMPELFALYPEIEWVVFLDRRDKHLAFPFFGRNIHLCYIWADNNMLSNVTVLPFYLRKWKVDVMVFQTFVSPFSAIPSIAFIHDVLFRDHPQFFTWKERLYFVPLAAISRRYATRLVATTEFVAGTLLRYGYAGSRSAIDIVPLGVDGDFKPAGEQDTAVLRLTRQKFGLPERYLLYVGRLNVRKNIEMLLRSLLLMQDRTIPLVIVGKEDWKAPDLRTLLDLPEIRDRIVMTGGMTEDELRSAYALATVFCFPSYAEGFGLPPLEAMASGVPVVVARTTALPEVCGDAALYIDPESPASIATTIDLLLTDRRLYEELRSAGLGRARMYTWDRSARALMKSVENTFGGQLAR